MQRPQPRLSILLILFFMVSWSVAVPYANAASPIRGQMVLDVGQNAWESGGVTRPFVLHSGSAYMMWYSGQNSSGFANIGYATSADGVAWSRYAQNPVLTGSAGQWDAGAVSEAWVIQQGGQFKMWYSGIAYFSNGTIQTYLIGYATSPDGIHWTKYSGNPVVTTGPAGAWDDRWIWRPIVLVEGSSYTMYYRGLSRETSVAKTGIATSTDGVHWTKTTVVSIQSGGSGWDAYSRSIGALSVGGVMMNDGIYVMGYIGLKAQDQPSQIGFASSTDGQTWTPYTGNPVITYGGSGWDSDGINRPVTTVVSDNYYVYYDGRQADTFRIGLAILPMSQYAIPEYPSSGLILITALMASIGYFALRRRLRRE